MLTMLYVRSAYNSQSTQFTPTIMSNSQKLYEHKSHGAHSRRTEEDHQEVNPNRERGWHKDTRHC